MTLNQSLSAFIDYLTPMTISQFAIIDLDNDGTPEVVLSLNIGVEILHYQNGSIYGYDLVDRAFMNLKTDGTFSFSSGPADNGFGTISFTDTGYKINEIAYSESSTDSNGNVNVSYYISQKIAMMNEFDEAVNQQKDKPDEIWYNYTNSNIETQLYIMEMNIASPLTALDAVKNYIKNQSDSSDIFSNLDSNVNPPAYYFQESNILIQYDSSHISSNGTYYLFYEYEYVVDDPQTGLGHTVTYNWFRVDAQTGNVTPMYNSDGSLNSNY